MKKNNSLGILVVGGCHVLGYPIGASLGFPDQLAALLTDTAGDPISLASIGHLKLSHGPKVFETVRRLRPEILILQVGHFELTNGGSSYSTKKLALSGSRSASKNPHKLAKNRFQTATGRLIWHVRCAVKDLANRFLSRWKVDLQQLETEFNCFLYEIAQCSCRVILLSPLPCADPIFDGLRRQAGSCFKSVASRYPEVEYLDVLKDPFLTRSGFEPFLDGTHLSADGHFRLAQLLASQIARSTPSPYIDAPTMRPFQAAKVREQTLTL